MTDRAGSDARNEAPRERESTAAGSDVNLASGRESDAVDRNAGAGSDRGSGAGDSGIEPRDALGAAVRARLASLDSGNYRANNELVLSTFAAFLREERGVTDPADVDPIDCRRYAQWLRGRVRDDDDPLSAASAHADGPYFTVVRAFLAWCVDDERIEANPARPRRVRDALPEYRGDPERQFWSPAARARLLEHVTDRARDELDGAVPDGAEFLEDGRFDEVGAVARDDLDATAFRDRAVVAVLSFTGVRGAEVFADPRDEHRNGLRWSDVALDRGVARVFGKSRERQAVALTDEVVRALRQYRTVLEPATDRWPVFPTRHRPSLSRTVRAELSDRGWSEDDIEAALASTSAMELLRRRDLAPPALSTNGARSLMRRLCDAAGADVDGDYLKPHGGRRALGHELYAVDAELAQETLRHRSIETTHDAYREQDAVERRDRIRDALER